MWKVETFEMKAAKKGKMGRAGKEEAERAIRENEAKEVWYQCLKHERDA